MTQDFEISGINHLKSLIEENENRDFYQAEWERIQKHFEGSRPQLLVRQFGRFILCGITGDLLSRIIEFRSLRGVTLKKMICQYGEVIGTQKFNDYCEKQAVKNTFEFKSKKYGMTEDEFKKFNKSRSQTLKNMIARYGEEEGRLRWQSYCKTQSIAGSSESYFIEKYGEVAGKQEWKRVNSEKGRTLANFIKKYGEVDGRVRYEQYKSNQRSFASKMSQSFFWKIFDFLLPSERDHCYFDELNFEFGKMCDMTNTYRKFDFVISSLKYCLEFNGDVFHANPSKFSALDCPNFFKPTLTAAEIWRADEIKNNILIEDGFMVDIVWEFDYNNNLDAELNRILRNIDERRNRF
jgi:hypothetical protein